MRNFRRGFTLIEVLTVMTVILILAGITIGTYSYVNNRGARARAEGEIAALGAACENYKLDNGEYPNVSAANGLNAQNTYAPESYEPASKELYNLLRGSGTAKSYFSFRPVQLGKHGSGQPAPSGTDPDFIRDPWGNSYGYSTMRQSYAASGSPPPLDKGFNPTFDLWSTAGNKTAADRPKWVRNW